MMFLGILLAVFGSLPTPAATLEKLNLDEMIQKSTDIVRGRVTGKSASKHGSVIYTDATVSVIERWKGSGNNVFKVSTPGGRIGNVRQTFPGSPELHVGADYVFFLWTGPSGVTQIVGLSQGVLNLKVQADGKQVAMRSALSQDLVDPKTGKLTADDGVETTLVRLRGRVRQVLAKE
jgi:hypothetical protein